MTHVFLRYEITKMDEMLKDVNKLNFFQEKFGGMENMY